jgi:PAS domain S-box-containing protein
MGVNSNSGKGLSFNDNSGDSNQNSSDDLINILPNGFAIYSFDKGYLQWNKKLEEVLGYSLADVVSMGPLDFYDDADKEMVAQKMQDDAELVAVEFDAVVIAKDGRRVPIAHYVKAIIYNGQKCMAISGIDISEIKNTEAALQKTIKELSDYKIALDVSSIVSKTDPNGIINFVNDNFCKVSKYSREELIGQDHRIINSGYHSKEFIENMWQTIFNGNIWRGDICNKAKDGITYWVESTIVPFINEQGKIWQYVSIRKDISDRKRAEHALLNSEANLKTIFDTSDTAYTLLDVDFKVLSFNAEASKFALNELNWKGEVGDYLPDYFLTSKKHTIEKVLEDAKAGKHINYESNYPQPDGTVNWYLVMIYPVADFDAKVLGVILSVSNITNRKLAELQREKLTADLIQRNKDLEQFKYIVSHNLRAPVANIIGFAHELQIGSNTEVEKAMYVKELAESASKLDNVIKDLNQILQVKREVSESKELVSFSETLQNIEVSISNMIKAEGVEIHADFTAINEMNTLKSYLYSIFYNLITNSIKYRRPNVPPVIKISSHKTDAGITLFFKDNGMGIDLDKKGGQVFGLYKRFHTQRVEGKGMGLFMTKTQVETIGGKITVNSKVDVGTEFILEFVA